MAAKQSKAVELYHPLDSVLILYIISKILSTPSHGVALALIPIHAIFRCVRTAGFSLPDPCTTFTCLGKWVTCKLKATTLNGGCGYVKCGLLFSLYFRVFATIRCGIPNNNNNKTPDCLKRLAFLPPLPNLGSFAVPGFRIVCTPAGLFRKRPLASFILRESYFWYHRSSHLHSGSLSLQHKYRGVERDR